MLIPSDLLNVLIAGLVAIVGWNVRQAMNKLEIMETAQKRNSERLVRIETRLGIMENHDDLA
jgi:hypothetical protein